MSTTGVTIAHRFTAAYNDGSIDALLSCFTEETVYDDLIYGRHRGHGGIRRLFRRMVDEGRSRWTLLDVYPTDRAVAARWRFDLSTTRAEGPASVSFEGMSAFELCTDGTRCAAYREYFDRTGVLMTLGYRPRLLERLMDTVPTVTVTDPVAP